MHVGTATAAARAAAAEQPSSPIARRAAWALLPVPGTTLAANSLRPHPWKLSECTGFPCFGGALGGVRCGPLKVVASQVEGEEAAGFDGWRSPCKGRSRYADCCGKRRQFWWNTFGRST